MERPSLTDRDVVTRQLGRAPRGRFSIARRCTHGFPQVLEVSPMMDGDPFPTLYWISCPFLRRAIGELEAEGWVKRFEERLLCEAPLRDGLDRAHDEYARARRDMLTPQEVHELDARGQLEALDQGGIGGIVDRTHLKCLHLHAAHALVGENCIGRAVLQMLAETACRPEKKICSSLAGRSR